MSKYRFDSSYDAVFTLSDDGENYEFFTSYLAADITAGMPESEMLIQIEIFVDNRSLDTDRDVDERTKADPVDWL